MTLSSIHLNKISIPRNSSHNTLKFPNLSWTSLRKSLLFSPKPINPIYWSKMMNPPTICIKRETISHWRVKVMPKKHFWTKLSPSKLVKKTKTTRTFLKTSLSLTKGTATRKNNKTPRSDTRLIHSSDNQKQTHYTTPKPSLNNNSIRPRQL